MFGFLPSVEWFQLSWKDPPKPDENVKKRTRKIEKKNVKNFAPKVARKYRLKWRGKCSLAPSSPLPPTSYSTLSSSSSSSLPSFQSAPPPRPRQILTGEKASFCKSDKFSTVIGGQNLILILPTFRFLCKFLRQFLVQICLRSNLH